MDKYLVVVESPAKVKSIQKYLGAGYEVKASKGHIADLPKSDLGVDLENDFSPKYEVTNQKSLSELKAAFKGKERLILATDPDREGEAIGWHVAQRLGVIDKNGKVKKGQSVERIVFTSITKAAVQEAVKHARSIDTNLFNAQQGRRVLDRLVGYKLSPLLWKKIRFGLSAGRVQSVALRLVVDRELEREAFVSEEYWDIKSTMSKNIFAKEIEIKITKQDKSLKVAEVEEGEIIENSQTGQTDGIVFELSKIDGKKVEITKEEQIKKVLAELQDKTKTWVVKSVETKETKRYPKPPFTTSTLQQTASNWLGMSPKQTMSVAQKLYEGGIITYMRTDSTNLSPEAVDGARKTILDKLGKQYLPASGVFYKTKAKVAQEAHEAIRPTDFTKSPKDFGDLPAEQQKLYKLIWQRALACQMQPAILDSGKIEVASTSGKPEYLFSCTGQKIVFDGYLKIYPEKVSENLLPDLAKGQNLYIKNINANQHFTQPPARYSEASLIKALETYGIGRPSTYVPTITTIQTRQYVTKEGKYFTPTDVGRVVCKLLKEHFPKIIDFEFTAKMENELDEVANGERNWVTMMSDFYKPFSELLLTKDKEINRTQYTVIGKADESNVCPVCGGGMDIKLGKYGRFYSCSKWPDCKGMLGEDGRSEEDRSKELEEVMNSEHFAKHYNSAPKTDDGRDFLLKHGRFGKFWAHPDYPKVKDARPLEFNDKTKKAIYGVAPKGKDGKKLILRGGKFGEFWAHPDYPRNKEVVRIDKKLIAEKKAQLGLDK